MLDDSRELNKKLVEDYEDADGEPKKENDILYQQTNDSNVDLEKIETLLFPHAEIREIQDQLIRKIDSCIKNKQNLIVHAPTGLGKTAATLSPALTHILKRDNKNLTIYFLTSRHTQHKIVIETLKRINEKFNLNIMGTSIIGKKHLCLQPGTEKLPSKEFAEFCRLLVEDGKCEYYTNVKHKERISADAEMAIREIKNIARGVASTEYIITESSKRSLCPYEISILLAKSSRIIISDYQYIFNPSIRDNFFKKINKELKDAIIIVDEAHNLPSRVKDLSSEYLSNITIKRAITEAKKYNHDELASELSMMIDILENYAKNLISESINAYEKNTQIPITLNSFTSADKLKNGRFNNITSNEQYITKQNFIEKINKIKNYDEFISEMVFIADSIREDQSLSYIGAVGNFLQSWLGQDECFTRIVTLKKLKDKSDMIILSYRCLDPSLITAPVINAAYSTILMSGTLTPTSMYKELLGINSEELVLKSPFPQENRLNIIVPKTSTKYEARNQEQYKSIASTIVDLLDNVRGCASIYFPSYYLLEEISKYLTTRLVKTVFTENSEMNKQERQEFLEKFAKYKDSGAILLAVISGSFAEGIDLPGLLKMVIIVGLPLQKPDLETKALIEYYDNKFHKGWDYGYLFPAFTKTIQAAGRCIRSEKDKGIIVFLDERYAWNNYYRCFPQTWSIKVTLLYKDIIKKFFESKTNT
jgi:DNA excision repair protein ERCC-2